MTDKEKAAEGWVDRYGIPEWLKTDTDEDRKRYSCDGCDQSISSIREAFLAGAEWATPKWIKCSERLPPIDQDESENNTHVHEYLQSQRVLVWIKNPDIYDSHVFTGRFVSVLREKHLSRHAQWFEGDSEGSVDFEEVTHWMLIPEAPKEEG